MTFTRVAILNRGDAAMRFLRTARELAEGDGPVLDVVAVFTDPDVNAPFVRLADDTIGLGPAMHRSSDGSLLPAYCAHDLVIDRLLEAGCEAVWPGWGFVSEDAAFVERLDDAGIVFIGPPAAAMRALGDKVEAKLLAEQCGVPLAPWGRLDLSDPPAEWLTAAASVGYPVMVKAANGGGGRGIRRADEPSQLVAAVRSVIAETTATFGDGAIFVERCIDAARHVEVQFLVGADGRSTTFGVRDCSIQRRHQKVIEESPSPVLSPVEEGRLTTSTSLLAESAGYRGVGTAEFLYVPSSRTASFCEVNARLQVEHTVTEMVWGIDLVRAQIDVALGRTHEQSPGPRGWAVEARVVAEDAERGFAPAPGRVLVHRPAAGPNVRVDAGIRAGSDIPAEFDSMIAKVLAWGPTRDRALATLARAVGEYEVLIEDGATNRGVLLDLLGRDEVVDATATTTWLESVDDLGVRGRRAGTLTALAVAAIELAAAERATRVERYFDGARSGVPTGDPAAGRPFDVELTLRGCPHQLSVCHRGGTRWSVGPSGRAVDVSLEPLDDTAVVVQIGGRPRRVLVHRGNGGVAVDVEGTLHRVGETDLGVIRAAGPALVVALDVEVGDLVDAGQRIGTVESMKTEAPLTADVAGAVERVLVPVGSHVGAGQAIVVLRPVPDGSDVTGDPTRRVEVEPDVWPAARRTDQTATPAEAISAVDSVLLGFELSSDDLEAAIALLADLARSSSGADAAAWAPLTARLSTFVQIESLFERNLLLLDDHSAAVSAESAFHDLCRRHGEEAQHRGASSASCDGVRPLAELEPLLERVLASYGADDGAAVRTALWRLASTRARVGDRERLMIAVVRALASMVREGGLDGSTFVAALADIERVSSGAMSALADAALLVRAELGTARTAIEQADRDAVDASAMVALHRYKYVDVDVLDAVRSTAGLAVVARVVSHLDTADSRTVLAIEFSDVPADLTDLDDAEVTPFAELFDVGVGLLRRRREDHERANDRDSWWAALHLVLHGARHGDAASLLGLTNRFEPGTRGLALQDFTVALVPDADAGAGDDAAEVVEFSLRRRGHARLEIDASVGMLSARPRSDLDRRALTAKRLGVVDPWELIGMLEGRVRGEELPHPSLARGRFVEHDLVADADTSEDRLAPVERGPAGHTCSLIVGVVANPLPGRDEWAERVLIAGDPLRSMGSLGEAECRRVIAAIDLADERGVPVEWVALSSGARIAWDSGTENLDWTAAVLRRIVEFTSCGGEIDVVVAGINVGAQSYWNAEATMLMHTRGILVMTPTASMVLTGKRALEFSGSVGAADEIGIGGHDRIMGPNGQAQYRADDLAGAYAIVLEHHALTYARRPAPRRDRPAASGRPKSGIRTARPPVLSTSDPIARDICLEPYKGGVEGFATVGEIFDPTTNPGRKRPFSVRSVMDALVDSDAPRLERWRTMADADGAVVWESRIGGRATSVIGIESRPRARTDAAPVDGPTEWAGGTLYPASSKKVARALRSASGNRPVVILANLSGFDGSPESLRRLQLEYGAEIARAVVEFDGRIVFVVIGRYHGGAYVVFSKRLNDGLVSLAVEGSFASVIGGAPAAAVVLTRDVRERAEADPLLIEARRSLADADDPDRRLHGVERLDAERTAALARAQSAVAADFDAVHTVERAVTVGSLDAVIPARTLRPEIIAALEG